MAANPTAMPAATALAAPTNGSILDDEHAYLTAKVDDLPVYKVVDPRIVQVQAGGVPSIAPSS